MTVTTPIPARTDAGPSAGTPANDSAGTPANDSAGTPANDTAGTPAIGIAAPPVRSGDPAIRPLSLRTTRLLGAGAAAGALTWAVGCFVGGMGVDTPPLFGFTSLAFQIGLLMLLRVQTRSQATGTGKVARGFLVFEHVLVGGAIISTLNDIFLPSIHGTLIWGVFDACWPLSMLGMFGIAIRIAIAGRWQGVARYWPLVAESWALVSVPSVQFGSEVAGYVGGSHLLVGYMTLGLIVALRPELTGAKD